MKYAEFRRSLPDEISDALDPVFPFDPLFLLSPC